MFTVPIELEHRVSSEFDIAIAEPHQRNPWTGLKLKSLCRTLFKSRRSPENEIDPKDRSAIAWAET